MNKVELKTVIGRDRYFTFVKLYRKGDYSGITKFVSSVMKELREKWLMDSFLYWQENGKIWVISPSK